MEFNPTRLLLGFLAALLVTLTGCSSTPSATDIAEEQAEVAEVRAEAQKEQAERNQAMMENEMKSLPSWVIEPPKADSTGFYGVGLASDLDLLNAMRKAKLQAAYELAQTMKSELSGEDTMTGSGEGEYRYVINNFVDKVNLSGAELVKQVVDPVDGKYKAYVLMKYPYSQFNQVLQDQKTNQAEMKTLDEAYQRLMAKVER
ncbi:hypothetical protein THMIRHAM_10340 [Thiomicrorhabdus immobilis]|uniref:LPP20 lipoprotein n=1 Tax=Thiomicrorhabdus immobilis TaxID=2791037 RepID=A0ABM7MCV8_9GAMM|nr:hypothetical protein [Thiomicrorhabdus immobilis]BCN93249.1 hypothetical protein THMIRHAM_10340 [Thiomicrorhabdus immobilis]